MSRLLICMSTWFLVTACELDDSSTSIDEQALTGTVTTSAASYNLTVPIVVNWSGLPGSPTDWIAIAPQGSAFTSATRWAYTGGATSGSATFEGPSPGTYVVRAFSADSYTLLDESAPFVVKVAPSVAVTTDASSYFMTEDITISWVGLDGNALDWVSIAPVGSPDTTTTTWVFTNGLANGDTVISGGLQPTGYPPGNYVARAYINGTFLKVGESAAFVTNPVTLLSLSVKPTNSTIAKGTTRQFTATGFYSDGSTADVSASATWSSSATTVATIAPGGLATGQAIGTTTITAQLGGATASTNLTVSSATLTTITVTPANPKVASSYTIQFTATGTFSDGSTQNLTGLATWTSSAKTVASIIGGGTNAGRATVGNAGTTTITATYGGKSGSTILTGTTATLVSIAISPPSITVAVGQTKLVTAIGTFNDGTTLDITSQVNWHSSDSKIASVGGGVLKGKKKGSVTITAAKGSLSGTASVTVP